MASVPLPSAGLRRGSQRRAVPANLECRLQGASRVGREQGAPARAVQEGRRADLQVPHPAGRVRERDAARGRPHDDQVGRGARPGGAPPASHVAQPTLGASTPTLPISRKLTGGAASACPSTRPHTLDLFPNPCLRRRNGPGACGRLLSSRPGRSRGGQLVRMGGSVQASQGGTHR